MRDKAKHSAKVAKRLPVPRFQTRGGQPEPGLPNAHGLGGTIVSEPDQLTREVLQAVALGEPLQ